MVEKTARSSQLVARSDGEGTPLGQAASPRPGYELRAASYELPRIGVLALQGDVREHLAAVARAGGVGVPVKTREALESVEALIIPGGESTTVGKLLDRFELMEPLRRRAEAGMPLFGTCTGLILMAREIAGSEQPRLGLLDVEVERNAFGRQLDSFEADLEIPSLGEPPVRAVFIRAPRITRTGPEVEVLASVPEGAVLVRQGRLLGCAFHPELTDDARIHTWVVRMAAEARREREGSETTRSGSGAEETV
jgi:pyridoxal 5'-phosphate synthase pdxT subunit